MFPRTLLVNYLQCLSIYFPAWQYPFQFPINLFDAPQTWLTAGRRSLSYITNIQYQANAISLYDQNIKRWQKPTRVGSAKQLLAFYDCWDWCSHLSYMFSVFQRSQVYRIAIWGYSLLSVSFHITGIRNASFKQTFRYLDDKTVSNANLVLGINCAHGHRSVKVQGGEEAEVWGNTTLVFQQIKVFTVFSAILI